MSYVEAAPLSPRARRRRILRRRFLRRPAAVGSLVVVVAVVLAAVFAPLGRALRPVGDRLRRHPGAARRASTCSGRTISGATRSRASSGARAPRSRPASSPRCWRWRSPSRSASSRGYYRGKVDTVIARVTDVLLAFPFLILAVGLAAILGPSLLNATLALGIAAVPAARAHRPRRDARAARGGLRARRGRERRQRRASSSGATSSRT